ncbi:hypothetical protein RB195_000587 [Necator americanus]|uniref:Uncharacterized protein n=1 Tax=Necator americanus TaxID=51031 RepID=A0ABR1DDG6_NECAM
MVDELDDDGLRSLLSLCSSGALSLFIHLDQMCRSVISIVSYRLSVIHQQTRCVFSPNTLCEPLTYDDDDDDDVDDHDDGDDGDGDDDLPSHCHQKKKEEEGTFPTLISHSPPPLWIMTSSAEN